MRLKVLITSALIGGAVQVTPAVGQDELLRLDLACLGQYSDTETTTATVGPAGEPQQANITTDVMRPGTARVSIQGDAGEMIYPDGRRRTLSNITADPSRITAEYVRRVLFVPLTWRIEIDRMTGDIRVVNGGDVGFIGTCEAAPTTAKF